MLELEAGRAEEDQPVRQGPFVRQEPAPEHEQRESDPAAVDSLLGLVVQYLERLLVEEAQAVGGGPAAGEPGWDRQDRRALEAGAAVAERWPEPVTVFADPYWASSCKDL